jgi:hypothetical protein
MTFASAREKAQSGDEGDIARQKQSGAEQVQRQTPAIRERCDTGSPTYDEQREELHAVAAPGDLYRPKLARSDLG